VKELFDLCWMMLGWFVAVLIFMLVTFILILAICLCIETTADLIKELKRRRNENIQR